MCNVPPWLKLDTLSSLEKTPLSIAMNARLYLLFDFSCFSSLNVDVSSKVAKKKNMFLHFFHFSLFLFPFPFFNFGQTLFIMCFLWLQLKHFRNSLFLLIFHILEYVSNLTLAEVFKFSWILSLPRVLEIRHRSLMMMMVNMIIKKMMTSSSFLPSMP